QDPARNFLSVHGGRTELLRHVVASLPRIHRLAAGKHIDGRVSEFGPRMDGQMRFGNDDHSADALRAELVERYLPNFRAAQKSSVHHDLLDGFAVVQDLRVTPVRFAQDVTTQSLLHLSASLRSLASPNSPCSLPTGTNNQG